MTGSQMTVTRDHPILFVLPKTPRDIERLFKNTSSKSPCFAELAHRFPASQVCYSWIPASHFLKKKPCHFKNLVPCLGHISMFLAAVTMLPAVQICPIRHSPTGWNVV